MLLIIPILTLFANTAILLDIPFFREIMFFVFLSFVPGFAILRLFKLKEISLLDTILFSAALSIAFAMFMGLLIGELYLFVGLSQPLSTIPLTVSMSVFTLAVFFVDYKRDFSETSKPKVSFCVEKKNTVLLSLILFLLPLLSALSVFYLNLYALLLSCIAIAALCVISGAFRRLGLENLFPFLIFSISVALVCQVVLTSNYIVGADANLEFYVFKLTQLNGYWAPLDMHVNSMVTLTYGSMLSITLLPSIYSALMGVQGDIVFKILYPFIFCLVPLVLYRISEKQFGRLIGLLSALFFTFTYVAFLGPEPLSLNRQIVGELFLLLSIFLLINKAIPLTERRLLLIFFGAALAVSHYSLAYVYLIIITVFFIVSKAKHRFDNVLNSVTLLLLFVITISWYALATGPPLLSATGTIEGLFKGLTTGFVPTTNTASGIAAVPEVFTVTTWINLLLTGISYLFLITGTLLAIVKPKLIGISSEFKVLLIASASILVLSIFIPNIASTLNFSRFYAISLLFLSPCFVLGGKTLLMAIGKVGLKIKRALKRRNTVLKNKNDNLALLLIAIILGAYFLSQVGFVNYVGNGTKNFYSIFFESMITSKDNQTKMLLYGTYIPTQDVFSASWLQSHKAETSKVLTDSISATHVLISYGLIPNEQLRAITNNTFPPQNSFIYLGSLNLVNGVISTNNGFFNTSESLFLFDQNSLVYSNGDSEIYYVPSVDSHS